MTVTEIMEATKKELKGLDESDLFDKVILFNRRVKAKKIKMSGSRIKGIDTCILKELKERFCF